MAESKGWRWYPMQPNRAGHRRTYYREGIPVRSNLNIHGDVGEPPLLQVPSQISPVCLSPTPWSNSGRRTLERITTPVARKRYYGQVATDAEGAFSFTTLMPGRYLNGPTYRLPISTSRCGWARTKTHNTDLL